MIQTFVAVVGTQEICLASIAAHFDIYFLLFSFSIGLFFFYLGLAWSYVFFPLCTFSSSYHELTAYNDDKLGNPSTGALASAR